MIKKSIFILIILIMAFSAVDAQQKDKPKDPRDVLIGSFASSVVYLMHSNFDLMKAQSGEILQDKQYYTSMVNLLSVINKNFKKQMDDLIENGNISTEDVKLLSKLTELSEIYTKQVNTVNSYLKNEKKEDIKRFIDLHSKAKKSLQGLFNDQNKGKQ